MKPAEKANQKLNNTQSINPGKSSHALQAYFEARDVLLKKYELQVSRLKK